jgi:hypothetical protein
MAQHPRSIAACDIMKYTYMKWLLLGKATLNTCTNVKIIEHILSLQQTGQELDEEEKEEHEEATTQKPTCNEAIEHLNAL